MPENNNFNSLACARSGKADTWNSFNSIHAPLSGRVCSDVRTGSIFNSHAPARGTTKNWFLLRKAAHSTISIHEPTRNSTFDVFSDVYSEFASSLWSSSDSAIVLMRPVSGGTIPCILKAVTAIPLQAVKYVKKFSSSLLSALFLLGSMLFSSTLFAHAFSSCGARAKIDPSRSAPLHRTGAKEE